MKIRPEGRTTNACASFDASVVILTANRLAKLRRLLEALAAQSVAPREILVIDNGSSDGTREWLARAQVANLRVIEGSARFDFAQARNRAIAEARGEWVVFIDDDCVPAPGWLARAQQLAPELDALGGPVLALRSLPAPAWFDAELAWAIGLSPPGAFAPDAGRVALPQTANLAVRRSELVEYPFRSAGDTSFDAGELARYAAGREDAELWTRLRVTGSRAQFDPAFCVLHDIDPARVDRAYIRERMRLDARASAVRSVAPRPIVKALDEVAASLLPGGAQTLADRLWRVRQWTYLRACRALGEPRLAGGGLALRLLRAMAEQFFARAKRALRGHWMACVKRASAVSSQPRQGRGKPDRKVMSPRTGLTANTAGGVVTVVARTFIGDMVILAPILCWLRERLPRSTQLFLVAGPRARELYGELPVADRICVETRDVAEALRSAGVVFVPYCHGLPPRLLFGGRGPRRAPVITFDQEVGFARRWWYDRADVTIAKDLALNEFVNLTRLFAPLGLEGPPAPLKWPRDAQTTARVDRLLDGFGIRAGEPVVGVHLDATHLEKSWPLERWAALLSQVGARYPGHRFVVTGAADQAPAASRFIRDHALRAENLCGRDDLRAFPELARRMALFVSTDSGPRHLAAAVGCPTITLYGWTDPRRWGSFFEPEKHLALCAGDPLMTAEEIEGHPQLAIRRIAVESVFQAVCQRLDGN